MKLSWTAAILCSMAGMVAGLALAPVGAADKKEPAAAAPAATPPAAPAAAPTAAPAAPEPLVAYTVGSGPTIKAIDKSLTGQPGDAAKGEKLIVENRKGNCFACHEVVRLQSKAAADPKGYSDMGQIGPRLDGVGTRYTEGELRLLVVNSKQVFPETLMPAFYRVDGLNRVTDDFAGKTILTPQEVEDVVAYLKSLDEPQRSETAAKDAKPTTSLAATYAIVDGPHVKAIDASLTGKPGDAANGEKLVVANKKGNCFACHEIAALQHKAAGNPQGYSDMGQIAPRLDGVATRYTEGELRMLVADSKQVFPQSLMPGFLVKDGLNRVNDDFAGKTILEPQEVEDVVAFLKQLSVDTYAGMGGMSGMRDAR